MRRLPGRFAPPPRSIRRGFSTRGGGRAVADGVWQREGRHDPGLGFDASGGGPMMAVRDLMTPNPVTVTPQTTLAEVWDLMRELEIRHLPVVEDNSLIGMVSDRDLAHLD